MRICITGSQQWGDMAGPAEEMVAGFISQLPKTATVVVGGLDEGVELWSKRYAQAYGFRVTEFLPTHVKGAKHYVRNFSQRDKNIAENTDKLFCFLNAAGELEVETAGLMTGIRIQHVAHTVYSLAPDEENEDKLKLVNVEEVTSAALLPDKEKKVGTQRSSTPSKTATKRPKNTRKPGNQPATKVVLRRNPSTKPKPLSKSRLATGPHSVAKKARTRTPVSGKLATAGRTARNQPGKKASKRVVLKRIHK